MLVSPSARCKVTIRLGTDQMTNMSTGLTAHRHFPEATNSQCILLAPCISLALTIGLLVVERLYYENSIASQALSLLDPGVKSEVDFHCVQVKLGRLLEMVRRWHSQYSFLRHPSRSQIKVVVPVRFRNSNFPCYSWSGMCIFGHLFDPMLYIISWSLLKSCKGGAACIPFRPAPTKFILTIVSCPFAASSLSASEIAYFNSLSSSN